MVQIELNPLCRAPNRQERLWAHISRLNFETQANAKRYSFSRKEIPYARRHLRFSLSYVHDVENYQ